jgi:hypothetical protein
MTHPMNYAATKDQPWKKKKMKRLLPMEIKPACYKEEEEEEEERGSEFTHVYV